MLLLFLSGSCFSQSNTTETTVRKYDASEDCPRFLCLYAIMIPNSILVA